MQLTTYQCYWSATHLFERDAKALKPNARLLLLLLLLALWLLLHLRVLLESHLRHLLQPHHGWSPPQAHHGGLLQPHQRHALLNLNRDYDFFHYIDVPRHERTVTSSPCLFFSLIMDILFSRPSPSSRDKERLDKTWSEPEEIYKIQSHISNVMVSKVK